MGFTAPLYLWGVAIASLPIVVHLLNRRRLRKVAFSSLRLLSGVRRDRFNWLRLRDVILLVTRTLLIALLFLALARPYLRSSPLLTRRRASVVLIVDDSYSMGYLVGDSTGLDRARVIGQRILDGLLPGSEVEILCTSSPRGELSPDLDWAKARLEEIPISWSAQDLSGPFTEALRLLEEARLPDKEIWILTDLQRRALLPLLELRAGPIPCYIIDLGVETPQNCGVVELLTEPLPQSQAPGWVKARIRNYGTARVTTNLSLRSIGSHRMVVELEPGEERWVEFLQPLGETLWVELEPDGLRADDRRCLVTPSPKPPEVLLVYEDPRAIYYLTRALNPSPGLGFRVSECRPHQLGAQDLSRFSVVGVIGLSALSPSQGERLEGHLRGGGGLFIAVRGLPRDRRWLEPWCEVGPLLNLPPSGFLSLCELDYSHPILSPFGTKGDLTLARFFGGVEVSSKGLQVLARLSDRSPWLLAGDRVVVVSTGLDLESTDLPLRPSFLPLIHRCFLYLSQQPLRPLSVGDTIEVRVEGASPVEVIGPQGGWRVLPQVSEGRMVVRVPAESPGLYRVGAQIVPVNPDPEEGDLTRMRPGELEGHGLRVLDSPNLQRADLSPLLLWVAAGLLLVEILLLLIR